jgi:hypothetical protein
LPRYAIVTDLTGKLSSKRLSLGFISLSCHVITFPISLHPSDDRPAKPKNHSQFTPVLTSTTISTPANIHTTHPIHSSTSIDLDLDRDRALLRLQHNQVVVVRNVLNGSIDKTSARDNLQGNQRSHNVDLAVRQARKNEKSAHTIKSKPQVHRRENNTYFSPTQLLPPFPNANNVFCSL